jgi:hypothetical protein
LNIRKKTGGMAFTAILLSAMIATVAAPIALASATISGPVTIGKGGGASTTPVTFTLTEATAICFAGGVGGDPNALDISITDSAGGATVHFSAVTIVSPGSLAATQSLTPTDTNIKIAFPAGAGDNLNIEQITVTAKISADAGAATGSILTFLTGNQAACVTGATGTATGLLSTNVPTIGGNDPAVILTGYCLFVVANPPVAPTTTASITGDARNVTAVGLDVPDTTLPHPGPGDTQSVTFGPGTTAHLNGETVTQTVPIANCSTFIGNAGTIAAALTVSSTQTNVNVGENSQVAGSVTVSEAGTGTSTLLNADTLTFTISSPATGVLFSTAPTVAYTGGDITGPATCALSVDRHTCTVAGLADTSASAASAVTIFTLVDVDTTVPLGTKVQVTVTSALATLMIGSPATIATVGTINFGVAAQPVIYIGFNDQMTGVITMTESGVGFFVAGIGGNNTFAICPLTGETFIRAPWAVITNPTTTDLRLLTGVTGGTSVKGTLAPSTAAPFGICAYWTIFSKSTTAPATIQIVGSDASGNPLVGGPLNPTDGPRLSVPKNLTPGSTQFQLLIGTQPQVLSGAGATVILSNAVRAFKNSVTVTAASQPRCPQGATDCLGGNIVITETQNGQFKPNDRITLNILPRATTQRMDVLLQGSNTNQLPVVSSNATASGLFVSPVGISCTPSAIFGVVVCTASFVVTQQSFGPALGQITVSNIHYVVAADAVNGPVNVDVVGTPCSIPPVGPPPALICIPPTNVGQAFDSVVTNAVIGALTNTTIVSSIAVGVTKATCSTDSAGCAFTAHTASTSKGTSPHHAYVTVRFQVSGTGSDGIVDVYWVHVSDNGALPQGYPGSYTKVASVPVVSGGWAFFFADAKVLSHNGSLRASFIGVVRPSTTYSTSRSKSVQAHWT